MNLGSNGTMETLKAIDHPIKYAVDNIHMNLGSNGTMETLKAIDHRIKYAVDNI